MICGRQVSTYGAPKVPLHPLHTAIRHRVRVQQFSRLCFEQAESVPNPFRETPFRTRSLEWQLEPRHRSAQLAVRNHHLQSPTRQQQVWRSAMKAVCSTCSSARWARVLLLWLCTCGGFRVWQATGFGLGVRRATLALGKHTKAPCSAVQLRMSESRETESSGRSDEGRRVAEASGRREFLRNSAAFLAGGSTAIAAAVTAVAGSPKAAGAIGELYEFKDQARFAQHVAVQVPDMAAALKFYVDGIGMKVLSTRAGSLYNTTVVGFGPEALEVPPSFVFGVSAPSGYGGHFTVELTSQKDASVGGEEDADLYFDPGNGVQFLQIAVDSYRISQVVKAGGIIESGYGFLQVLSPGGLRVRLLSGSRRDPPMFLAVKAKDMKRSIRWYKEVAGMTELPFPRARAPGSPFEPDQPKDSVFMAYEGEAFGVLLVPAAKGESVNPGGVVSVAALVENVEKIAEDLGGRVSLDKFGGQTRSVAVADPDGYVLKFVDYEDWHKQLPRLV